MLVALLLALSTGAHPGACATPTVCSCADGGPTHLLEISDAVFIGWVLSTRDTTVSGLLNIPEDTAWVVTVSTVRVLRGWKDPGAERVDLIDPDAYSSCRAYLPEGRVVIAYAKRVDGRLILWGCGPNNRPLVYAKRDLELLGPTSFFRSKP